MNRIGHFGFSLLFISPLFRVLPYSDVFIAIALTMLPDVDLVLRIEHRKYTHNITFASIVAILFYAIFKSPLLCLLTFSSVLLHIAADLMTKQKFAPLYPIYKKKFALKLFNSNNKPVNYTFFLLGLLSFSHFSNPEILVENLIRFI